MRMYVATYATRRPPSPALLAWAGPGQLQSGMVQLGAAGSVRLESEEVPKAASATSRTTTLLENFQGMWTLASRPPQILTHIALVVFVLEKVSPLGTFY